MAHMVRLWHEGVIQCYKGEGKGRPRVEVHDIWGEMTGSAGGVTTPSNNTKGGGYTGCSAAGKSLEENAVSDGTGRGWCLMEGKGKTLGLRIYAGKD